MELIAQVVLDGLALGLIYAMAALGLSLAFGVMHVINVAHGDMIVLSAFIIYWIIAILGASLGVNGILVLLLAGFIAALTMFILGYILQLYVVNRVIEGPPLTTLLLFFGIMLILPNLMTILWGPYTRTIIIPELTQNISILSVKVPLSRIFTIIFSLIVLSALIMWLYRTKTGIAIRATAQNREAALICGVNIKHIYALTLAISISLTGFAGLLVGINMAFAPTHGFIYTLFAFLIVVLGGMGYPPGAIVGGIIIGYIQVLISTFLGTTFVYAFVFLALYLTLLLRPRGILGRGV